MNEIRKQQIENQIRNVINTSAKRNPNVEPYKYSVVTQLLKGIIGERVGFRFQVALDNICLTIYDCKNLKPEDFNEVRVKKIKKYFTVVVEDNCISVAKYNRKGDIIRTSSCGIHDIDGAVKIILKHIGEL